LNPPKCVSELENALLITEVKEAKETQASLSAKLMVRMIVHCSYNCIQANPGKADECINTCVLEGAATVVERWSE